MPLIAGKKAIDIGVIVSDIDASLNFYVDMLGLEKVQETPIWNGMMHRLAFGDSFIKLIDPKTIPPQGSPNLEGNLGFRYLTLQVTNINELCEELGNKGIEFTLEKKEYMPGVTIAMVKDPDGNIVEFVERA